MTFRPTIALLAILGLIVLAPSAQAQRGGGRAGGGRSGGRAEGRGERLGGALGYGWAFLPPYYPENEEGYWPPPQPQYIPYPVAVQPPGPAAETKPVEPLMIEERSGQWVRVENGNDLPAASQGEASASSQTSRPTPELPSAVIVFRDGHQEEVAKYMIEGNVLYASADYSRTGSWTRRILLTDVDLAATLKLNQERGTKFALPSSPSEIMIRF